MSHMTAFTSLSLRKVTWISRSSVPLVGSIASQESTTHRTAPHLRTQRSPNRPSATPRSVPRMENTPTAIVSQLTPRTPSSTRASVCPPEHLLKRGGAGPYPAAPLPSQAPLIVAFVLSKSPPRAPPHHHGF